MNWTLEIEEAIQALPRHHKNIRTLKALENLIKNLDKIPIERIESITEGNSVMLNNLYEEIKHGDDEHQKWLKDKIQEFIKREKI